MKKSGGDLKKSGGMPSYAPLFVPSDRGKYSILIGRYGGELKKSGGELKKSGGELKKSGGVPSYAPFLFPAREGNTRF